MVPSFVINLETATARREAMAHQFTQLGMPFEILRAVDGRTLTPQQRAIIDHRVRRRVSQYPLTDGELGCYFSHRQAMQRLLDGDTPMAVVFEDDSTLYPALPLVLQALEERGRPFDFVFLHRIFKKNESFAFCRPLLPNYALGRVGPMSIGAQAYVVSREGAERFLAQNKRIGHSFDKELHRWWANGLDLYHLENPVAMLSAEILSDLEHERARRMQLPNADSWQWKLIRRLETAGDSVRKRALFRDFVRRGRDR
jgi:glycosyl transferase, family 25